MTLSSPYWQAWQWHVVYNPSDHHSYSAMKDWCLDNVGPQGEQWQITTVNFPSAELPPPKWLPWCWHFAQQHDALQFTLTWMGDGV